MLMTLLVKTEIGVSYTLQQMEQKLYLVLWKAELVSLFANKLGFFVLLCFLTQMSQQNDEGEACFSYEYLCKGVDPCEIKESLIAFLIILCPKEQC